MVKYQTKLGTTKYRICKICKTKHHCTWSILQSAKETMWLCFECEGDVSPCPWCKERSLIYIDGSYVKGWTCFVECSNYNCCGARGPMKCTTTYSVEEHKIQTQAIQAWNSIARGK